MTLACVQACYRRPPLSCAFDCHQSSSVIISLSAYVMLYWGKFLEHRSTSAPLFGCSDPIHILKAFSRALRTPSRILKMLLGSAEPISGCHKSFARLLTHVNSVFVFSVTGTVDLGHSKTETPACVHLNHSEFVHAASCCIMWPPK